MVVHRTLELAAVAALVVGAIRVLRTNFIDDVAIGRDQRGEEVTDATWAAGQYRQHLHRRRGFAWVRADQRAQYDCFSGSNHDAGQRTRVAIAAASKLIPQANLPVAQIDGA